MWNGPGVRQIAHENEWLQRRWLDLVARERAAGRLQTRRRDLDQLLTSLFHALSSDWAFLVTRGQSVDYARRRAELHRRDFHQLAQLVEETDLVRALGSRHSFTDLADTAGSLVSLESLPAEIEIDAGHLRSPPGRREACRARRTRKPAPGRGRA